MQETDAENELVLADLMRRFQRACSSPGLLFFTRSGSMQAATRLAPSPGRDLSFIHPDQTEPAREDVQLGAALREREPGSQAVGWDQAHRP